MSYITDITASEMIEATRLTREGRLAEATALLNACSAARPRQTRRTTHRAIPREGPMSDLRRISWQSIRSTAVVRGS